MIEDREYDYCEGENDDVFIGDDLSGQSLLEKRSIHRINSSNIEHSKLNNPKVDVTGNQPNVRSETVEVNTNFNAQQQRKSGDVSHHPKDGNSQPQPASYSEKAKSGKNRNQDRIEKPIGTSFASDGAVLGIKVVNAAVGGTIGLTLSEGSHRTFSTCTSSSLSGIAGVAPAPVVGAAIGAAVSAGVASAVGSVISAGVGFGGFFDEFGKGGIHLGVGETDLPRAKAFVEDTGKIGSATTGELHSEISFAESKPIKPKVTTGATGDHVEKLPLIHEDVSGHPTVVEKHPAKEPLIEVLSEVKVLPAEKGKKTGETVEILSVDERTKVEDRKPEDIKHVVSVPNKQITVEHNLHGRKEGIKGLVKGMTTVTVPTPVPKEVNLQTKIKSHAKNHLNINVKPQVGISAGAGLENMINNITDTDGRAYAELLHASAGSYKTKCSRGIYARASTAEASASWNVFSASANGPAASAGLHTGVGSWAAAYANAELARAEAVAGPVSVGVGLNANTGASIGLDGLSASLLGFGVSVGPRMSVKTPVADVSCSIM